MFTGLITGIGTVTAVALLGKGRDARFVIQTPDNADWTGAKKPLGASIACSGVCLTVVESGPDWFAVEVSAETLAKSTLGLWAKGSKINLEGSLRIGDELGGHIVSGHVDGIGEVLSVTEEGGSHRVRIRAPRPLHRYIASKGSIGVEGVSLTVNEVEDDVFGVNIIPHTWDVTTLGGLKAGSRVNLEIDMLARYLARWQETAA